MAAEKITSLASVGTAGPKAKSASVKAAGAPITTLMFLNVPRKYTPGALIPELEACLGRSVVDFVYMPRDEEADTNMGFCFVNFCDANAAEAAWAIMDGMSWRMVHTPKSIRITQAHVQGFAKNLLNCAYKIPLDAEPKHCPLVFQNGQVVEFRAAVKSLVRQKADQTKASKAKPLRIQAVKQDSAASGLQPVSLQQGSSEPQALPPCELQVPVAGRPVQVWHRDRGDQSQRPTRAASTIFSDDVLSGAPLSPPGLPVSPHKLDADFFGSGCTQDSALTWSTNCEGLSEKPSEQPEFSGTTTGTHGTFAFGPGPARQFPEGSALRSTSQGLPIVSRNAAVEEEWPHMITDAATIEKITASEGYRRAALDVRMKLSVLLGKAMKP